MYRETISGKPERVSPIPGKARPETFTGQSLPTGESGERLAANAASVARHPLGRGLPPDHEALQ
jgi:hypothetical protein